MNDELESIIKPMIGEVCHQVEFSYGDQLVLNIGEMSHYTLKKISHILKGKYQLFIGFYDWIFMKEDSALISSSDEYLSEEDKEVLKVLEGKRVLDISISSNLSTLIFEEGYQLIIQPDTSNDNTHYWELFLPSNIINVKRTQVSIEESKI